MLAELEDLQCRASAVNVTLDGEELPLLETLETLGGCTPEARESPEEPEEAEVAWSSLGFLSLGGMVNKNQ